MFWGLKAPPAPQPHIMCIERGDEAISYSAGDVTTALPPTPFPDLGGHPHVPNP